MVPKRFVFALVLMAFGLTACPIDLIDQPLQDGPYIEVSATEVRVGEPVRIDLSVTWANGTSRDHVLPEQSLGVEFCKSQMTQEPETELCQDKLSSMELASIQLLSGDTFEKNFGEVMVKSGRSINLTHSFSFTSTEPLALYPLAFLGFPPGSSNYSGVYQGEKITFQN